MSEDVAEREKSPRATVSIPIRSVRNFGTHVRALTLSWLTERWRLVESTRERLSRPVLASFRFLASPVCQLLTYSSRRSDHVQSAPDFI